MKVTFHRLGSCQVNQINVDQYELISYDGYLHDILYMDMYHSTKSKLCPKGYRLEEQCTGFRGINQRNDDFPFNQYQTVLDCVKNMIGFPTFDIQLKTIDAEQAKWTISFCKHFAPGSVRWWK